MAAPWCQPPPLGTLNGWNYRESQVSPSQRYSLTVPKRSSKARDMNSLARRIVDEATGEQPKDEPQPDPDEGKDPAAVELGRRGGLKGGKARAEKLSAKQRSEIARKAAATRWKDR